MDDLIIKSLRGEATERETATLERWRVASPVNDSRYRAIAGIFRATAAAGSFQASSQPPPIAAILTEADRRRTARRRSVWALGVAAGLIVGVVGVWAAARVGDRLVFAAAADARTVTLADGSFVRLAPGSRLLTTTSESGRRVVLRGTAFFAVAQDPSQPFHVQTVGGTVRVLGTRFELRASRHSLRLIVVEGRVQLEARTGQAEVRAGELAVASSDAAPLVIDVADPYALLDWRGAFLLYQATPLRQVLLELERSYGRAVRLADSSLAGRTVTASFSDETFEEAVEVICLVTGTRCVVTVDGVRVEP